MRASVLKSFEVNLIFIMFPVQTEVLIISFWGYFNPVRVKSYVTLWMWDS